MRHGSLESGIGCFDYAAEMIGWENIFSCEINPFGRHILKYYWPKAEHHANVFEFDGTIWAGKVDIITCGFPCQPFSHAGKRKGSKDDRFIWPENMRIVREAQPGFVLAENVPGLLTIEDGMVFEQVCTDLENEGYEVTPLIIPAVATDKDHRRDRVWIVAYRRGAKLSRWQGNAEGQQLSGGREARCQPTPFDREYTFDTHTTSRRLQRAQQGNIKIGGKAQNERSKQAGAAAGRNTAENWLEAAARLCSVDDGTSGRLDTSAISKSRWRIESLRGYGNAIIWEIAYEIFKAIELSEKTMQSA